MRKRGLALIGGYLSRSLAIYIASIILVIIAVCWHMGSLPLSSGESSNLAAAKTAHQLLANPVNAPHQAFIYLLQHFHQAGRWRVRAVSAGYYLVFLVSFYFILKSWFGTFSARLGAALFGFTPFLLLIARSATSDVMYLFPLVVVACYMSLMRSKEALSKRFVYLVLLAALSLYEPGGLLFLLAAIVYGRGSVSAAAAKLPAKTRLLAAIGFLILVTPLVYACLKTPDLVKTLALVPTNLPQPVDFLKWTGWSALALAWRSGLHNYFQIGKLAILDGSQIILVCFGVYALWDRAASKAYLLAGIVVYAVLESAFNQSYDLLIYSLPALMVLATAGLRYLHIEWNSVFPRNPLPRGLALAVLLAVVGLHVVWGLHYSLTAWPNSFGLLR